MARKLSEQETDVLRAILEAQPHGATGNDIAAALSSLPAHAFGVSVNGCHRTAASLVRKNLAWRAGDARLQVYKITQTGRQALARDQAGRWIAR